MQLNQEVEIVLGLLVALAALAMLARRVRLPYPVVFVLGGLALALLPGLPPLIYAAATVIPLRDVRAYLRPITLLAVGLVLAMTAAIAVVAHTIIPSFSLGPARSFWALCSRPRMPSPLWP